MLHFQIKFTELRVSLSLSFLKILFIIKLRGKMCLKIASRVGADTLSLISQTRSIDSKIPPFAVQCFVEGKEQTLIFR